MAKNAQESLVTMKPGLEIIRHYTTWALERLLQKNISLLNSLAESPDLECPEWPKKLREVIAAIEEELAKRKKNKMRS
jgi:hypothetical protein